MGEPSYDIMKKGMLDTIKSASRIQQEKGKMMMNMLENDYKMGGNILTQMMKNKMDPSHKIKQQAWKDYQAQGRGGAGGPLEADPSGKIKRLSLSEQAQREFAKPEAERNQDIIKRYGEYRTATRKPEEIKEFDPTTTEEVFFKLMSGNKTDEDFQADLEDLKKYRKTYEDMGVDVVSLLKRGYTSTREKQPKKSNALANVLNFFKERF